MRDQDPPIAASELALRAAGELPPLPRDHIDIQRWAQLAERPEFRLLALADIGVREVHYVHAGKFPERYPGHRGGSLECPHADCRAVYQAIRQAILQGAHPPGLGDTDGDRMVPER